MILYNELDSNIEVIKSMGVDDDNVRVVVSVIEKLEVSESKLGIKEKIKNGLSGSGH
jgi:hypothetical protein